MALKNIYVFGFIVTAKVCCYSAMKNNMFDFSGLSRASAPPDSLHHAPHSFKNNIPGMQ